GLIWPATGPGPGRCSSPRDPSLARCSGWPKRATSNSPAAGPGQPAPVLADAGRQVLIGRQELGPSHLGVGALTPGDVRRQILDVDLDPRPVGGEMVQGQAPFLPDQDGLAAVAGQRDL